MIIDYILLVGYYLPIYVRFYVIFLVAAFIIINKRRKKDVDTDVAKKTTTTTTESIHTEHDSNKDDVESLRRACFSPAGGIWGGERRWTEEKERAEFSCTI